MPPEQLGDYLREFRQLLHKHGYDAALYGHFGDGCIHCRINFDLSNPGGIANWKAFMQEAADLVVRYGGSLSGEHGDGQVRAQLLPRMYGEPLVEAMRQFKSLWDPQGMMNPGKVVDPYPMTENLRGNPRFLDASVFAFSKDSHSFARAVNRCVGIGECRRASGGVMCPSYRATLDEQHSTRGRARLLFEMLRGDSLKQGWRDELPELFHTDERAQYLARHSYLLAEFLCREGYQPPHLARRALVHLHCHQYASLHADADREMLERMGVGHRVLDAGCCGMAGSFGFDAKKFDLSQRIGEQQLLPQVRASAADTLIITNGFSCKEQIAQATGRRTWNMAEIMALALDEGEPNLVLLHSTSN